MLPRRGSQQAFWTLISILGCANGSMQRTTEGAGWRACCRSRSRYVAIVQLTDLAVLVVASFLKDQKGGEAFSQVFSAPLDQDHWHWLTVSQLCYWPSSSSFACPSDNYIKKAARWLSHTQHVMRNGLSASSNLDQKSLKSLINGYIYLTIFQISKRFNRAKMHSISYIGCKKVYSNIDHPGRKLSNRTSGTA